MPKNTKTNLKPSLSEDVIESPVKAKASVESLIVRLSQQFNLLTVIIIALFLFQGYTFYKLTSIEKNGTVAGAAQGAQGAPAESPLTQDKLISYAEELKLDKGKFEQCLTKGASKDYVVKDAAYGQSLKVQGTPGFFINGRFLAGAFPFETFKEIIDKEIAGEGSDTCDGYSETAQQYCNTDGSNGFNPTPVSVEVGSAPVKGKADAKVTIVEFSDFECPFCARAFPTVQQIIKTYPNEVRFAYKHLPLTNLHPNAQSAAEASVCAASQGKFWEYHDKLFTVSQQG